MSRAGLNLPWPGAAAKRGRSHYIMRGPTRDAKKAKRADYDKWAQRGPSPPTAEEKDDWEENWDRLSLLNRSLRPPARTRDRPATNPELRPAPPPTSTRQHHRHPSRPTARNPPRPHLRTRTRPRPQPPARQPIPDLAPNPPTRSITDLTTIGASMSRLSDWYRNGVRAEAGDTPWSCPRSTDQAKYRQRVTQSAKRPTHPKSLGNGRPLPSNGHEPSV